MIHLIRVLFLLTVMALTFSLGFQREVYSRGASFTTLFIVLPVAVAVAVIAADMFWQRKRLSALGSLFFGGLAGVGIAYVLSLVVDMVVALLPAPPPAEHPGPRPLSTKQRQLRAEIERETTSEQRRKEIRQELLPEALSEYRQALSEYQQAERAYSAYIAHVKTVQLIKVLLGAISIFLCVSVVMQTKDDFRFVIPYVEFAKQTKGGRPAILDTSVIIDGRIADVTDTGILESELVVPRFVLAELQSIADSDDKLKRNRGRRGLDVLNRLQASDTVDIQILDAHVQAVRDAQDVDAKLVALARHLEGRIVTNDYNLNKIARLRNVPVININDLANALKPVVLPGESLRVRVIKPGEEPAQGVGYLDDGTMVVAEHGRDYIGRDIVINVTSVLQTSAGRMIFGRLDPDKTFSRRDKKASRSNGAPTDRA